MAATASSNVLKIATSYPEIGPETRAQLALERKRLMQNPDGQRFPAELNHRERFVFRTRPGTHRLLQHDLPMPPNEAAYPDPRAHTFALRVWARLVAQPAFPNNSRDEAIKLMTAKMEDLYERLGDRRLLFTRVPYHVECYYATNDEVVAAYLRDLVARGVGDFKDVYEQSGRSRVVVGDKAFPDTQGGWGLARAYAAEHGIEDIKLVKE